MLQQRSFKTVDAALAALALEEDGERNTRMRIVRHDGSVVEGVALEINVDGVTLAAPGPDGPLVVPQSDMRVVEIRVPDRRREWIVAGFAIALVTGLLVGISRLPGVGPAADYSSVVVILYLAAAAATPFLIARTPLGRWLHRWRPIFAR